MNKAIEVLTEFLRLIDEEGLDLRELCEQTELLRKHTLSALITHEARVKELKIYCSDKNTQLNKSNKDATAINNPKMKMPIHDEIAAAISFLQSAGYAVVTTAMDNETISDLSTSEVKKLAMAFPDALTAGGSLYLVLSNLEENFENFDEEVKAIVEKIISSIPQKTGRPELVLI